MSEPKLKPCPFCRGELVFPFESYEAWVVLCAECEAEGPAHKVKTKAIALWNRREPEAAT